MDDRLPPPDGFFLLHAGATNSWESNLDRQQAIQEVLSSVASTARASLCAGALALDVVEEAVVALEDCPFLNAGKGSALTEDGTHELEAAIVDGKTGRYGAVAGLTTVKNPVHTGSGDDKRKGIPIQGPVSYGENYRGFLTTRYGSLSANLDELTGLAAKIRQSIGQTQRISIPCSWRAPSEHALKALQSEWYTVMFRMQSTMYHDAIEFFQRVLGYEYLLVPVTTASISSPMGLSASCLFATQMTHARSGVNNDGG
ncbi:hypothetical protein N0V84_011898 [Fusarium piperis]|uniref:Uncharacterized protein n=1 Tax=Fusarium piperis TaxID=1435070 RepID=A0A9W8TCH5_9HYPO|nr:hypothetical protein N0V84_011898 [Fusarium piperis]